MNFEIFEAILACITLLSGLLTLVILTIIDFKVRLLPNIYVAIFAICGICFHAVTGFLILSPFYMAIGCFLGGGFLYAVRAFGNWYYKQETLGLGDVKLMAAAGLWLGPEYIITAITIGATLSVIQACIYAMIQQLPLRRLEVPFGPGLIGGIIVMMGWVIYLNPSYVLPPIF